MRLEKNKGETGSILFTAVIGLLVGLFLILLNADFLLKVVFVVMGVVTVVYSLPGIAIGLSALSTSYGKLFLVLSLLSCAVGVWMIFWHSLVLMVILGVYMILSPVVAILLSKEKIKRLLTELPKILLGVVMLLLGPAGTLGFLFDVAGAVIAVLSVGAAVLQWIGLRKRQNKTGGRIFADTTGDGKLDTLYVDTTGDGKADTSTTYFDDK